MEVKLDDEIFDSLLFMSRLSASTEEAHIFIEQIKKVIGGMDSLRNFVDEPVSSSDSVDEKNFRTAEVRKGLEANDLKQNSADFLDGYFRVPKVLENS